VALMRKRLGMGYLMDVVGVDASAAAVRGSHGRPHASSTDGPVFLCSDGFTPLAHVEATEVKEILSRLARATG
jgi:hypothetical protein